MANVSSSNGLENRPKLRFPGFDEPWEETTLSAIFIKNIKKNTDGKISNVICNSAKFGLIPQREYFDKDIANSNNTNNYYIIQKNDFVYNPRKSADAPYGPISSYKYSEDGIVSPLYLCFRAKCEINPLYFEWYFRSSAWHRYVYMSGDSGARHDRVSIKDDVFFDMPIYMPSNSEQKCIATFLEKIEFRIEKQKTLIETLKKYKRGLLQQIFSRKLEMSVGGESWEYILLGEIGCFFGGLTGKSKENFDHGDSKFITYMNVYKNTFADETMVTAVDVLPNERQNAVRYGDILFTQSSETVEEVGLTSVWVHDTTPYLNSFCMALRPHSLEKFNPYYLGYVLRSPKIRKAIMKEGQGISRINLAASRIENIPIPIPPVTVQIKIVDYLKKWDGMISANEKTLTGLISLKKAFLQSLFI